MKDPKEEEKHIETLTDDTTQQQSKETQDTNWKKNQQVDEEGNEVDPEGIK